MLLSSDELSRHQKRCLYQAWTSSHLPLGDRLSVRPLSLRLSSAWSRSDGFLVRSSQATFFARSTSTTPFPIPAGRPLSSGRSSWISSLTSTPRAGGLTVRSFSSRSRIVLDQKADFLCSFVHFKDAASSVVELYNTFVSEIIALNLPPAIEAKPIIDVRSPFSSLSPLSHRSPITDLPSSYLRPPSSNRAKKSSPSSP